MLDVDCVMCARARALPPSTVRVLRTVDERVIDDDRPRKGFSFAAIYLTR